MLTFVTLFLFDLLIFFFDLREDSDVDNIKSDVEGGSSDEAPEEIKIVKYFENEDPCDAEMQSKFKPAVRM